MALRATSRYAILNILSYTGPTQWLCTSGMLKLSNLILVDHDGQVVKGDYAVNRAGFVLHAAVHAEHPDILAMCAMLILSTEWRMHH